MRIRRIALSALAMVLAVQAAAFAGEVELRFAWWGGSERHERTLEAIKAFEAKFPDVKIKAEYMGWNGFLERLTTQMGSGSEPDIIQMDWAWLALFSRNGDGFYDLLRVKDDINLDAYDQKWIDTVMVKGKLNALPVSFTTRFFLWNKTTFDRAVLPLPRTWEDIVAAGPVFKEKLGDDYYPLDCNLMGIPHMMGSYLFMKTGKMWIDPDEPKMSLTIDDLKEVLGFYKRLLDNHALTALAVRAARTGDADTQVHEQPDYIEGRWCGNFQWDSAFSLAASTPKEEFKIVLGEFPTLDDAKNSGRIGRPAQIFAVSRNSRNPGKAAECINFLLTTPEAARILRTTRGALIAKPSFDALVEDNLIAPLNLEAMAQLEGVRVHTPSPYFEDPRMLKLLSEVFENLSYDKISVDDAAAQLHTQIPRLLSRIAR